ncbi:MAG: orotate phosphoribosyltransferase [Oscillospiraceae bacterium]|jgi:orotate phosphoribosyltransferase|nr:orotate phosphoribosyltransferase [Oscillospiraceae bacterium]
MTTNPSAQIAADLLSIRAVFLRPEQPFTWASGIQSPVYCDNRLTLSSPAVRRHVEEGFAALIRKKYPGCGVLMGTSTAGIAHAAIAAYLLELPMGYVRSGAKDHGRTNRIEGKLEAGQKVVVVEDLISTAGSALEAVEALREAGADVLGIVSIFTYGMQKGLDRLAAAGVENTSLTDFDTLVTLAAETGYIKARAKEALLRFRDSPGDPGWMALLQA